MDHDDLASLICSSETISGAVHKWNYNLKHTSDYGWTPLSMHLLSRSINGLLVQSTHRQHNLPAICAALYDVCLAVVMHCYSQRNPITFFTLRMLDCKEAGRFECAEGREIVISGSALLCNPWHTSGAQLYSHGARHISLNFHHYKEDKTCSHFSKSELLK